MKLIGRHSVELEDGRQYWVTLYDDYVYIGAGRARLKHGSKAFWAALRRLRDQSDPGSLTREHMALCADCEGILLR